MPVVHCCGSHKDNTYPYVSIDDFNGAAKATKHLLTIGRKRIALINGPITEKSALDRYEGMCQTVAEADIVCLRSGAFICRKST